MTANSKARTDKTFLVQATLTIVTYDCQNIFTVQATGLTIKPWNETLTEWERLSTVDLIVLTSLGQLLLKMQALFSFFTKQATLTRRSTVLSLPVQLVFPDET
jgi:hypothetical protein